MVKLDDGLCQQATTTFFETEHTVWGDEMKRKSAKKGRGGQGVSNSPINAMMMDGYSLCTITVGGVGCWKTRIPFYLKGMIYYACLLYLVRDANRLL